MKICRKNKGHFLPRLINKVLLSAGLFFIVSFIQPVFANTVYDAHTEVELISSEQSLRPGQSVWIALRMTMDPHWHVYWQNPGDSGLRTKISWNLPEGLEASEINWPYPIRLDMDPLTSYGYEEEVFLPIQIFPSEKLSVGQTVNLQATVSWLACKIECIPGKAKLDLAWPVLNQSPQKNLATFDQIENAKHKLPTMVTDWEVTADQTDQHVLLTLTSPDLEKELSGLQFYPYRDDLIDHAAVQEVEKNSGRQSGYRMRVKRSDLLAGTLNQLRGIIVNDQGWDKEGRRHALEFEFYFPDRSAEILPGQYQSSSHFNLWLTIAFAFLGGLILNVMPCVLPVLSLKILSLIEQVHSRKKNVVAESVYFTAGILVTFWILLIVLLILKSAGQSVGWGFQFQSPGFRIFMVTLLSVMSLNLFGVFEIGVGLTKFGGKLTKGGGPAESFFNGILATIVATPCMAPFMGTAVGAALTQSTVIAFVIFTFLGLGLAFPYFIISIFPALHRMVPKPGIWMIHFKKFLAFPLLMTMLWLVWVVGRQYGVGAMTMLLYAQVFIAIGLWIWGTWGTVSAKPRTRWIAGFLSGICVFGGLLLAYQSVHSKTESQHLGESHKLWKPFSQEAVQKAIKNQQAVFIDFTADWCLTCHVNKKLILSRPKVMEAFTERNMVLFEADWTHADPEITQELAKYGRSGVPLYVYYPAGSAQPVILPEIITVQILLDMLEE